MAKPLRQPGFSGKHRPVAAQSVWGVRQQRYTTIEGTINTEQLLQTVDPLLGTIGAASYFRPATLARGKEEGLDGFRFYFLGRGGVLGNVEAGVIHSAFGYFHPDLVHKMWTSAKEKMEPRAAGHVYLELARELGRSALGGVQNLSETCQLMERVADAADHTGFALSSGFAAEPMCDDVAGKVMQLATVLREHRGSAHLVALRACGVADSVAHAIKRPDDTGLFGWDPAPEATEEDRANYQKAQALTDTLVAPAYGVLNETEAAALASGLQTIYDTLNQAGS